MVSTEMYTSADESYFFLSNTSGDIYAGDPIPFVNVLLFIIALIFLDAPKSVILALTLIFGSIDKTRILSGLISLCKIALL